MENAALKKLNQDLTKSYYGTCQACFGGFVVHSENGKWAMVLHGYKRPGDGVVHGECWGRHQLPYELDCEITKAWLQHVRNLLPAKKQRLLDLESGKVTSLNVIVRDHFSRTEKVVKIDTSYKGNYGQDFAYHLRQAVHEQKQEVHSTEKLIEMLDLRVKNWKFDPQVLLDAEVEKVDAAKRDFIKNTREIRKFYRDWKELWRYVAEAIRDHKHFTETGYAFDRTKELLTKLPPFTRLKPKKPKNRRP